MGQATMDSEVDAVATTEVGVGDTEIEEVEGVRTYPLRQILRLWATL